MKNFISGYFLTLLPVGEWRKALTDYSLPAAFRKAPACLARLYQLQKLPVMAQLLHVFYFKSSSDIPARKDKQRHFS